MKLGMRIGWKQMILICAMALFTFTATAQLSAAFAQSTGGNPPPSTTAPASTNTMVAKCDDYPGITNRIVKCVRQTLENAGEKFFDDFYPMIARIVTATITLGVLIYGVMMAAGMVEKIGRDSIVLLLKIAFVSYFVQHTDMLYDWVVDSMDSLATMMFNFATINHPTAPVCMEGKDTIWERVDCLADTMFGIKTDAAATTSGAAGASAGSTTGSSNEEISGSGLARGLIAFFGSALVSSVPGFIIGAMGFIFLYTMLFFIVKTLFAFLMSYMALMFLMMIGPLFMPLVIFKATKVYFDKWVGLIISFALQPVIIVAFISFSVAALDVTVFSGEKSFVRTIAGDAAKQTPFNLNEYIDSKGGFIIRVDGPQAIAESRRNDADNTEIFPTALGTQVVSECGQSGSAEAAIECTQGWVVGISMHSIDWEKLAEARQPAVEVSGSETKEEAFMNELYAAAILMAVMMYVLDALMKVVPQIANDLVGSYRQTPNVFGTAGRWDWQNQAGGQASQAISRAIGNLGGGR